MRAGYASADITPRRSLQLSGFAARCNAPSEGVDDPLHVRALAVEDRGDTVLLLAYDLLAIGRELHAEILQALGALSVAGSPPKAILCTTHTHSAPATITLLGCGTPERDYWDQVVAASVAAAKQAFGSMRPARVSHLHVELPGQSYNRRRVLADGRVAMARRPDAPIRKTGPTWDRMLLIRLVGEDGEPIAGIASWAAHPIFNSSQRVTADYPGELCRRLEQACGSPFIYLQGACGNINPLFDEMTRQQMLARVDALVAQIGDIAWPEPSVQQDSALIRRTVPLKYARVVPAETLRQMRDSMAALAETGQGTEHAMKTLADILNIKPGDQVPPKRLRHIAATLQQWSGNMLERSRSPSAGTCDLALAAWRLGPADLCFVAAEAFIETAIRLSQAFPPRTVNLVAYAAPLVGYLPTDEALGEGGYEAAEAYIFYNHPAPFAHGSEPLAAHTLQSMIRELESQR